MTVTAVAVIAGLVFAWAVLSGVLARRNVTGPLVFAVAGYLLANPSWGPIHVDIDASTIHLIAEITLALLLFSDAARVNVHELRRDGRCRCDSSASASPCPSSPAPSSPARSSTSRGASPPSSARRSLRPTPL